MAGEREEPGERYRYEFAGVTYDDARRELTVDGLVVDIQPRPLQILVLLLESPGRLVSREDLLRKVWLNRPTVDNVIASAITKLRNALGSSAASCIENVPRVGYRLTGTVERSLVSDATPDRPEREPGGPVPTRPEFVLQDRLAARPDQEVWLAGSRDGRERRVYKFAIGPARVAGLKREVTLSRILYDQLGPRPDIVRILGWQFEARPAFIESEYGGQDLRAWGAGSPVLRAASLEQRIGFAIQIAAAIAVAHGVGVLHKDIKPSNILVRQAGDGWQFAIADFGIGHLLESDRLPEPDRAAFEQGSSSVTSDDETRGTLPYLAPELLRGEPATVRSDLYSLGIVTYQLLIGDMERRLGPGWERDVSDELLRADISAAVDYDPERRPASVQQWLQGLQTLEQRREARRREQALARDAAAHRRSMERAQARRPWIAASAVAICAGLLASFLLYGRVRDARHELERQYTVARSLNSFLTDDFIAMANPALVGRVDVTVADAARQAATKIDVTFANTEPGIRLSLHEAMQRVFAELSDYPSAISEGDKALALLAAARTPDPGREASVRLDMAMEWLERGDFAHADDSLQRADRLVGLSTAAAETTLVAKYWAVRARIEGDHLALPAAVAAARRAWQVASVAPEVPADLRDQIHFGLADALRMSSQFADAQREAGALLSDERLRLGPEHPRTCRVEVLAAAIGGYTGQVRESIALATHAATCLARALGATNTRTLSAYSILAGLEFQSDDYVAAANAYREVARRYAEATGPDSLRAVNARANLGVALHYAGDLPAAESELAGALESARRGLGWTSPPAQHLRYHLSDCRLDRGKGTAVASLLDGLDPEALNRAQIAPDWEGRLAYQAGRLALVRGDRARALEQLEHARQVFTQSKSEGRITVADVDRLEVRLGRRAPTAARADGAPRAAAVSNR